MSKEGSSFPKIRRLPDGVVPDLRVLFASSFFVFASAWGGIEFTRGSEHIATIWVANAILLVALLNTGSASWPVLLVGGYVGNVAANLVTGNAVPVALGLPACNLLEVLVIAIALRRTVARDLDLSRLGHFGIFVLVAGVLAPAAAGALAAGLLSVWNGASPEAVWLTWYPADALGLLVFTPLFLMLRLKGARSLLAPRKRLETISWFVALLIITALTFGQHTYPLLFVPMAALGVLAVRLGPAGMALSIGLVAIIATIATVRGSGPMMLVPGELATRILVLQAFVAVTVLSKLPLTALLSERARLEAQAQDANKHLLLAEKIAHVGHWRLDLATNALTWSDEVYRMHGLDRATHTPTVETSIELYHPDDRPEVARWVRHALEEAGEYDFALRIVRRDGAVRDVISRGLCEVGPGGEVAALFGTIMDVTDMRQAERAATESEARYRLLADTTTDMITHMDLAGRRLFVSPGSHGLLGYAPAELVGTTPQDMMHPDDRAGLKDHLGDLVAGRKDRATAVNRLRHKNGDWIWVEASLKVLRKPDGAPSGFVASVRDIMDRKRGDDALRESEARYRLLADHSSDLIALKPTFGGPRTYVSPSSRGVVGYGPDELAAIPAADYIHPEDQAGVATAFAALTAEQPQVTVVHRVRHKAGHWIWLDATFTLTNAGTADQNVIVRARDITARHETEQALAVSEARYRLLADNVSDLIVLGDAKGRRTYISPSVKAMLGYTVEEAHQIRMRDWVHPDDLNRVFAATQSLSVDKPTGSVTFRLQHKAGHYIWAEAAFQRVNEGAATIVTAIRDVSERMQQADLLKEAKVAAEAGARIKAEFLANMSHELRTPLTGMLGVHDLLSGDPTLDDRQRHLVELAQESGRSLLTIVNDILDFSKIEAGQMTIERVPFSVREVVASCQRLGIETINRKAISLTIDIDDLVPDLLVGDATRVRQVLLNLVTNAIKFTTEGAVKIGLTWPDGRLRVDVTDTGIGISASVVPKLFERFIQADGSTARRFGGTGLGLSICKRLVELMGGSIGVASRPGVGSTFWFELPLVPAQAVRRETRQGSAIQTTPIRPQRILVAEDNDINQEIIRTVLSQKGHRVTVVGDGAAAVRAFGRERFDIILMDMQMPGTDGLTATVLIRAAERDDARVRTPIVALTASALAEEAEQCRLAGMDAHVAKPIDWATLFATIERLCPAPRSNGAAGAVDGDSATRPTALDEGTLDTLAAHVGRDRIGDLLASFEKEMGRRLRLLDSSDLSAQDLCSHVHVLVSVAGQLGFEELSSLCFELQKEALAGGGLQRLDDLRRVAKRALSAASASSYAKAA